MRDNKNTYTRRAALSMLGAGGALAALSTGGYTSLLTKRGLSLDVGGSNAVIGVDDAAGNRLGGGSFGPNTSLPRSSVTVEITNNTASSIDVAVGKNSGSVSLGSNTSIAANSTEQVTLTNSNTSTTTTTLEFTSGTQSITSQTFDLPPAPPSSAYLRWSFDNVDTSDVDGDGNTEAIDVWGSNNGTLDNVGTTGDTGYYGDSYFFDASGANVVKRTSDSTLYDNNPLTVCCWTYVGDYTKDKNSASPICIRNNNGTKFSVHLIDGDLDWRLWTNNNTNMDLGSVSKNQGWTFIAVRIDPNNGSNGQTTLFIDDSSKSVSEAATASNGGPLPLRVGSTADGNEQWYDKIDDVRVYTEALTDTEVDNIRTTGSI